jgi:hypothetical protein
MSVYDIDSHFDYDYSGPNLTGLRGIQITGSIIYALVNDQPTKTPPRTEIMSDIIAKGA